MPRPWPGHGLATPPRPGLLPHPGLLPRPGVGFGRPSTPGGPLFSGQASPPGYRFGPPEGERSGPAGEGPAVVHSPPSHASRHNLTYWRRGRYLGLGAGAHEFDGTVRRWNLAGVPAYLRAVNDHRRPTAGEERLDTDQARFEALALRLRTVDGLAPEEARALGVDPGAEEAEHLRAAGLLAPGPALRLTETGMFLHGEVVARLA